MTVGRAKTLRHPGSLATGVKLKAAAGLSPMCNLLLTSASVYQPRVLGELDATEG